MSLLAFPGRAVPNPTFATDAGPNWAEQGQFWVALAGVSFTFVALFFVWRQVHATRQEGRADRVATLTHRHQDREFLRLRVAALRYVQVKSAEECYDRLLLWQDAASGETPLMKGEEPVPCMNDCRHVVQYFEEVAALYNVGAIDIDLAARFFPDIVVAVLGQYWWLLHEFREGKVACLKTSRRRLIGRTRFVVKTPEEQAAYETGSYAEWEALARNLYARNENLYTPSMPDEIWVVCLPPEGGDRDAYRELTKALSRGLAGRKKLDEVFGTPETQPTSVPDDVYCIAPWQEPLDVHLRCQRLAAAIHDRIAAAIKKKDYSFAEIRAEL